MKCMIYLKVLVGSLVLCGSVRADWKSDAYARIDTNRKADFTVIVQDSNGNRVPNATIEIDMRQHDFLFGSAMNPTHILSTDMNDTDVVNYQQAAYNSGFNIATFENTLKWLYYNQPRGEEGAAVLRSNRIQYRGHAIMRPSFGRAPDYVEDTYTITGDKVWLRDEVTARVETATTDFRGQFIHWDVVNEPHKHDDFPEEIGYDCFYDWFTAARESDPFTKLYITETAVLTNGRVWGFDDVTQGIASGLSAGEEPPVDSVGLQGHFDDTHFSRDAADKWSRLDGIANYNYIGSWNLNIAVTEYDFVPAATSSITLENEADFLEEWLTLVFSHPKAEMFMMWGFWDQEHWKGNSAMYADDWTLKPSGQRWLDLVKGLWWTDVSDTTDAQGEAQNRIIKGIHFVKATSGGQTASARYSVTEDGDTLVLTLGEQDADEDWILDSWEHTHFGNLTTAGWNIDANNNGTIEASEFGDSDTDGDGFSDLIEYQFNTDPNSASSHHSNPTIVGDQLTWPSTQNNLYVVEESDDLTNWSLLHHTQRSTAPRASVPVNTNSTKRFFRLKTGM